MLAERSLHLLQIAACHLMVAGLSMEKKKMLDSCCIFAGACA